MERTIEERLKELIIDQFGTMKNCAEQIGIPNPTLASILSRGIRNANVLNVLKLCHALGISGDHLTENKIVPVKYRETNLINIFYEAELVRFFKSVKEKLKDDHCLTIDNVRISEKEAEYLAASIDFSIDMIRLMRKEDEE